MRIRSKMLCVGLIAAAATWFCIREVRNEIAIRRAFPIVHELGGRIGALPYWPIGCEYHISFSGRDFSDDELQQLAILNELPDRNHVSITFNDTNVGAQQIVKLRRLLPRYGINRYVTGRRQDDL